MDKKLSCEALAAYIIPLASAAEMGSPVFPSGCVGPVSAERVVDNRGRQPVLRCRDHPRSLGCGGRASAVIRGVALC